MIDFPSYTETVIDVRPSKIRKTGEENLTTLSKPKNGGRAGVF